MRVSIVEMTVPISAMLVDRVTAGMMDPEEIHPDSVEPESVRSLVSRVPESTGLTILDPVATRSVLEVIDIVSVTICVVSALMPDISSAKRI